MHYRNGREAKNGDVVVQLGADGKITALGVLHGAVPGNDYCNGFVAAGYFPGVMACICDCLHADDVAELLVAAGLGNRPAGK